MLAGQASGIAPLAGRVAAQNGDQQRTVAVDRLNVRSGPGLGYSVVAVLSRGDIVSLIGGPQWADGYEWVKVAVWGTNTSGWVASQFLGQESGSPFAPGSTVHVAVDRLNLRSGAGTGYSVIRTYARGTSATVTSNGIRANGYVWVPVRVSDGAEGWFASEFLEAGAGSIPRDRVRVAQGPLRVRSRPSLSGEVYYSAPTGAYGTVMDGPVSADGYTWLKVQLDSNNVLGWMAQEFLDYIDVA